MEVKDLSVENCKILMKEMGYNTTNGKWAFQFMAYNKNTKIISSNCCNW